MGYQAKKMLIAKHTTSINERWMWHGTTSDNALQIMTRGFDRGYSTIQQYGRGTYFHQDTSYSWDYARKDVVVSDTNQQNQRVIILSRVLQGKAQLGSPAKTHTDLRDDGTGHRYDSFSNQADNIVVLADGSDSQAFPEFMLRFRRQL